MLIYQVKTLFIEYLLRPGEIYKNISWRRGSTISEEELIFVVGCPRSGTTLLHTILALHPDIASCDHELGLFSWRNIFARKFPGIGDSQRAELFSKSRDLVDFLGNYSRMFRRLHGGRYFIDKTPQYIMRLKFIMERFPKSKIIIVTRDGRDCYCSALKHPRIPQRSSLERFARYWARSIEEGEKVAASDMVLTMSYEAFVSDPETRLGEICDFLGVEASASQLDTNRIGADARSEHGHFKRLREPINGQSCGRWRVELSEEQVRAFEAIAGTQLARLGYPVSD